MGRPRVNTRRPPTISAGWVTDTMLRWRAQNTEDHGVVCALLISLQKER